MTVTLSSELTSELERFTRAIGNDQMFSQADELRIEKDALTFIKGNVFIKFFARIDMRNCKMEVLDSSQEQNHQTSKVTTPVVKPTGPMPNKKLVSRRPKEITDAIARAESTGKWYLVLKGLLDDGNICIMRTPGIKNVDGVQHRTLYYFIGEKKKNAPSFAFSYVKAKFPEFTNEELSKNLLQAILLHEIADDYFEERKKAREAEEAAKKEAAEKEVVESTESQDQSEAQKAHEVTETPAEEPQPETQPESSEQTQETPTPEPEPQSEGGE